MAIPELEIRRDLELVLPEPVDRKILGGIALRARLQKSDLEEATDRLEEVFFELRNDKTHEYGACIAYAIDLPVEDEVWLDEALVQNAKRQNHGMLTRITQSGHYIWEGYDRSKEFFLRKYAGAILLTNGEFPPGLVYSLVGGPKDSKN